MRGRALAKSVVVLASSLLAVSCGGGSGGGAGPDYGVRFLVSDGFIAAEHTDASLVNPWGIAPNPAGVWWVADAGTSVSTLYDGEGVAQSLVVDVAGGPTGTVYYGGSAFLVTDGTNTAPARFLFATEAGTILAWSADVPPPTSTTAVVVADESASGAIYKGLAIAGDRLYAADFHNSKVDVFNGVFTRIPIPGAFAPPGVPTGYAPFGIQQIGNQIFVTYALQDPAAQDELAGPGAGFVEVFDLDGNFVEEVAARGTLNAPWGVALAPQSFGVHAGDLLVGNFGDGRINAFSRIGAGWVFTGQLESSGSPIEIEGLWGIAFGVGGSTGPTNALFFAAGSGDEAHGLFGRIDPR